MVASLAEAWIEIGNLLSQFPVSMSPPSRRRGLKLFRMTKFSGPTIVASLAEAWIEMGFVATIQKWFYVASLAEAWIEIRLSIINSND